MNLFDSLIVIVSVIEQIFTSSGRSAVTAFRTVRILRTFRVLRVTKLLRALSFMKIIIGVVSRSLQSFIYIAALLLIFTFIYTLLGVQIFSGQFNFPDNPYRANFDGFFPAFLTVFQLMTIENWNEVLYLALHSGVNKIVSLAYLVSWIFIGNYILLNLFLAIILDEFVSEETGRDRQEYLKNYAEESDGEEDTPSTSFNNPIPIAITTGGGSSVELVTWQGGSKSNPKDGKASDGSLSRSLGDRFGIAGDMRDLHSAERLHSSEKLQSTERVQSRTNLDAPNNWDSIFCERSLLIFTKENLLRRFCIQIVKHRHFEHFILIAIFLSSVKLAIDTYFLNSSQSILDVLASVDTVINALFIVESCLKIISFGLILCRGSYLRDAWNILDFTIVCFSVLDMAFTSINLPFLKVRLTIK